MEENHAFIIGRIVILVPQLLLQAQFYPWTFKMIVLIPKVYF
jgi:hypothetical protein